MFSYNCELENEDKTSNFTINYLNCRFPYRALESMMKVQVNGKEKEFDQELTVMQLIESLDLNPKQVAVEVNRDIVKKEQFASHHLRNGDEIEILHFVGGGLNPMI